MAHHERQHGAGHPQESEDVGLHHGFPILVLSFRHGVQTQRAAGVVDKYIHPAGLRARPGNKLFHAGSLADVQVMEVGFGRAGLARLGGD